MKITVINGQNHKGSTYHTGKMLIDKIACEKNVTEFFLPRDLPHFCAGCYACLEDSSKCPYREEKEKIFNAMLDADLIVLTSPNYCMMPSAPMKAFFDLFFTNWMTHKPREEMFSKRAAVISTTAGLGAKKVTRLMATNLTNWGIPQTEQYAVAVQAMNWAMVPEKIKQKIEKDIGRLAKKLSVEAPPSIGLKTRVMFWFYSGMQKANWSASPTEKQYWEQKGWLGKKRPWKQG